MSIFPDEPTDEERQAQLPQDNEAPFRPMEDTAVPPTDTEGEDIDGQEAGAQAEQGSQSDDMGTSDTPKENADDQDVSEGGNNDVETPRV